MRISVMLRVFSFGPIALLLGQGLYPPGTLEIWVMDRDGPNKRQVRRLGAASFTPFFHPDGGRLVFASNRGAKARGETNVFVADWVEELRR